MPTTLVLLLGSGCGKGDDKKLVFPTRGKVFFEGQPTKGAFVVFHPLDDRDPRPIKPRARVEADGTFRLSTYNTRDGGPVGRYAVTVDWRKKTTDNEDDEGVPLLPLRYGKASTSGLHAEIKDGENELPPFQLKK